MLSNKNNPTHAIYNVVYLFYGKPIRYNLECTLRTTLAKLLAITHLFLLPTKSKVKLWFFYEGYSGRCPLPNCQMRRKPDPRPKTQNGLPEPYQIIIIFSMLQWQQKNYVPLWCNFLGKRKFEDLYLHYPMILDWILRYWAHCKGNSVICELPTFRIAQSLII